MSKRTYKPDFFILISSIVLLLVQIVISNEIAFRTGWDPDAVFRGAEDAFLGEKEAMNGMVGYFSQYPNNLFITGLFKGIMREELALGLSIDRYFLLIYVQCILLTLTGIVVYKVSRYYMSKTESRISYCIYVVVAGLSGWMVIPYTDSFGILFPVLILFFYILYLRSERKNVFFLFMLGVTGFIGFFIKPTAFIVFIAVCFIDGIYCIRRLKDYDMSKLMIRILVLTISIALSFLIKWKVVQGTGYDIDKEARFGVAHFLMMGLNVESEGGWSEHDMLFSSGFLTNKERDIADFEEDLSRIKEMGFTGILTMVYKKTLRTYSDGLFGFGDISAIYQYPQRDSIICSLSRKWYGGPGFGHSVLFTIHRISSDIIWYMVLAGSMVTVLFVKWRKDSLEKKVLVLSILGFALYELLFEVHPRYVFVVIPIFVVSSVYGYVSAFNYLNKKLKEKGMGSWERKKIIKYQ